MLSLPAESKSSTSASAATRSTPCPGPPVVGGGADHDPVPPEPPQARSAVDPVHARFVGAGGPHAAHERSQLLHLCSLSGTTGAAAPRAGQATGWLALMGTSVVPASSLDARTGVSSRDVVVDQGTGLAVRLYRPSRHPREGKLPVLLYFHGGAFVVESAFGPMYHGYLNALAARTGAITVSVNYHLAPEHPLPAAYDDSWAALEWVLENARSGGDPSLSKDADMSRLFLAGDSAGGNIAHNLAMFVGHQQQQGPDGVSDGARIIKGVALLDPYFLGRNVDPTAAKAWGFICAGRYGMDHPYVNPTSLPATAWRRLATARVLMTVSGQDGLGPWQRAYADAIRGSEWGGQVQLYVTPGEGHCFFLNNLESPNAAMHMSTLAAFVNSS